MMHQFRKKLHFKNPLQPKMKRRLSFFCKDPLQEFARTTENLRKKGSLCNILSLKFQEILTVILDRPVERYMEFLRHQLCKKVKKNHVPHVLSSGLGVKIRNEFKFKSLFKGRPQITMTLSRLWCPAVLVKTSVWMGSSVLQAHKTWSQSFLFKDFLICINKSFIRGEYSDRPGRKYRGCFVRESSVSKKK